MILRKRIPEDEYIFRIPGGNGFLKVLCIVPICVAIFAFFVNGSDYYTGGMVGILTGPIPCGFGFLCLLCGAALSLVNFGKMMLIDRRFINTDLTAPVAATICLAMFSTVVIAKLVGCTLPMLAKKAKLDPAVMASPFITTIVDVLSLLVLFGLASTILHVG